MKTALKSTAVFSPAKEKNRFPPFSLGNQTFKNHSNFHSSLPRKANKAIAKIYNLTIKWKWFRNQSFGNKKPTGFHSKNIANNSWNWKHLLWCAFSEYKVIKLTCSYGKFLYWWNCSFSFEKCQVSSWAHGVKFFAASQNKMIDRIISKSPSVDRCQRSAPASALKLLQHSSAASASLILTSHFAHTLQWDQTSKTPLCKDPFNTCSKEFWLHQQDYGGMKPKQVNVRLEWMYS